jgi:hypothetical protein
MERKMSASLMVALSIAALFPFTASAKKKDQPERAMLEKMEAVPCGAKQRGISGVGALWASAGITHINSDEKLCPQYLLRTDDMEYEVRPTDGKNPVLLPVGQEAIFKIKNNRILLSVPESNDKKVRSTKTYVVVAVRQNDPEAARTSSSDYASKP